MDPPAAGNLPCIALHPEVNGDEVVSQCRSCGQLLHFENNSRERCYRRLG